MVTEPDNEEASARGAAARGPHTGIGILLGNLLAIGLAVTQDWDLRPMLAIYWAQSVIIGFFNFLRIIRLENFSTEGFTSNGKPVPETEKGKWSTAIFFAFHFGFFHLVYLVFLVGMAFDGGSGESGEAASWIPGKVDLFWIGAAVLGFLASHWFSFRRNVAADLDGRPNLGTMMFLPYARIIPMHLAILLGFGLASNMLGVLLFSSLKTLADLLMHWVEHRVLQGRKRP